MENIHYLQQHRNCRIFFSLNVQLISIQMLFTVYLDLSSIKLELQAGRIK